MTFVHAFPGGIVRWVVWQLAFCAILYITFARSASGSTICARLDSVLYCQNIVFIESRGAFGRSPDIDLTL